MRLAQLIEYKLEMFLVLFDQVTIYKYIVKIYMYESSNIISENNCHEPLECSRSVTISLLHSMAHKCAINGGKHCFPHIFGFYMYLLIHVRHIDQRSIFCSSYVLTYLLLVGKRGYVFLRVIIAFASIDDGAKFHTVLLEDAKHWCCLRDIRLFPPSSIFICLDLVD